MDSRRRARPRSRDRWARPRRRRQLGWLGRGIALSVAVVLGLIAWAVLARAFAPQSNTSLDHFDVIIVLGSQTDPDGNPSPIQLARVTEAVHEYERGVAPRMILTGGATRDHFVEAQVMARTAEAQGIPASAIIVEPQAMNTIENTCNSLRIMRSHGWDSAEVVSSAFHLPRAALILSRLPLEWRVHAAPPLEPDSAIDTGFDNSVEVVKTVHYLAWSRQMNACPL